jgi:hypothetical protein
MFDAVRDLPTSVVDLTTTEEGRMNARRRRIRRRHPPWRVHRARLIAVRVSRDQRTAIVGAPRYFASHAKPKLLRGLTRAAMHQFSARLHRRLSLGVRQGPQVSLSVAVNELVVDDVEVMIHAALDGVGLAFALEEHVFHHPQSGALVRVLED